MSDLDQVKGLIAQGDKERAVPQLAAILMKNKHDIEAWLLLGEIIDDPSKKKDCYNSVLRLSPHNLIALTKLQELEPAPSGPQIAITGEAKTGTERPLNKSGQNLNYVPDQKLYPSVNNSNDNTGTIGYFIVGFLVFLAIVYVIVANFSNNIFWGNLIFLILGIGLIILLMINKKPR